MNEKSIDKEIVRIYKNLHFMWEDYGFHVKYLTRDYGIHYKGFIIGMENETCKIVFIKDTMSQNEPIIKRIGTKAASFTPQGYSYLVSDGWYSLTGLIQWISGVEYEYNKDVDIDLENLSQYLRFHIENLLDLFKHPQEFDRKLEHYRNLNKERQITMENIKAERSRLHALGLNSSFEAAIANLRGDKQ